MSHTCNALILHCMDFRLGKAVKEYLEKNNLLDNADIVSVAGAAKNLVSPQTPADAEFILRQIEISKRLHRISTVILVNHTDCGAYGGRGAFADETEEYTKHIEDLKKARESITDKFSGLEILLVIAKIASSGQITFQTIN